MKIKEYIEKLHDLGFYLCSNDEDGDKCELYVYGINTSRLCTIKAHATKLNDLVLTNELMTTTTVYSLYEFLQLTKGLLDTPIDERFPEKKYQLVWQEDGNDPWLIGRNGLGHWLIDGKVYLKAENYQIEFTDAELKNIAGDDEKMLDRLNAVKEEVPEDD